MSWQEILKKHNKIESVTRKGKSVFVNGVEYQYKYMAVARAVQLKVGFFLFV